jgi:hypothetical protein
MFERIERVRGCGNYPTTNDRPVPGWRRRLDHATAERAPDLLDEFDEIVTPGGVTPSRSATS